ncbi:MAG: hypothetical protein EAY79_11775 [Runella slithyformis]|nr:MAG: hypothetical protein EAY79_11775 [Runella slithyformis]TAF44485.1 MAG: hypothetical protein EAZ63_12230 [Runella slithyformis]
MKKTLIFAFYLAFWIVPLAAYSQNSARLAKVHIYNAAFANIKIKTHPANSKEIVIKSGEYVLIQSSQDSLAFVSGKAVVYLKLEQGRNYYLRVTQSDIGEPILVRRHKVIDEVTEREFQWTLLANDEAFVPSQVFNF